MGLEIRHGTQVLATIGASVYPPVPAPIAGQGYHLDFVDDFQSLDPSWTLREPYSTQPQPGAVTVADSVLTLRHLVPGTPSIVVGTRPRAWRTGYFEARLRWTNDPYAAPAFWLFNTAHVQAYPDREAACPNLACELDIVEAVRPALDPNGSQSASGTLHRNTWMWSDDPDGTCGQSDTLRQVLRLASPGQRLDDWHTWSCLWTENKITWFLDGNATGSVAPFDSTFQEMHLLLSIGRYGVRTWLYPDVPPPVPTYTEMQVDWVRVWQKP